MNKIYHYAIEQYDILMTRRKQGVVTDEELRSAEESNIAKHYPGPYVDHISFFLEEAPLDIIAKCFKGKHPFWKPGQRLIEHRVIVESLKDFKYHVVESPLKTAIYDNFFETPSMNDKTWERYNFLLSEIQSLALERGDDIKSLLEIREAMKGKTREMYLKIPTRSDFEKIKEKYAATVPHLMIYPETGFIQVDSIKTVYVK